MFRRLIYSTEAALLAHLLKLPRLYKSSRDAWIKFEYSEQKILSVSDQEDNTSLSPYALIALVTVAAAILFGIPMVYLVTTYIPGRRKTAQIPVLEDPRKVGIISLIIVNSIKLTLIIIINYNKILSFLIRLDINSSLLILWLGNLLWDLLLTLNSLFDLIICQY